MSKTSSRVGVVIAGAGSSQRMGTDKLLLPVMGKPLLAWSVDVCQKCELLDQIVIVLGEENLDSGEKLVTERGWSKVSGVCLGGRRRQDSVQAGIKNLWDCEWVVVHDGARPFLTFDLLRDGLEAARETGASAAAVPSKDTVKLVDENGMVKETLFRQRLWMVQTPQVFRLNIITRAYEQVVDEVTDDASLVEQLGYKVRLYMGAYSNIKITTPEDLALAEMIIGQKSQCELE